MISKQVSTLKMQEFNQSGGFLKAHLLLFELPIFISIDVITQTERNLTYNLVYFIKRMIYVLTLII